MKKTFFILATSVFLLAPDSKVYTQSAAVVLRPAYTDISDQASRGAVLMKLSGYTVDDARYRLYNGASQYNCWNHVTGSYVASNSYSSGPPVPGNPSGETIFWIAFLRGSNNSTSVTYRDRLGPDYSVNYQSAALPTSEPVLTPFIISGKLAGSSVFTLDVKYILLAWSGSTLITASHSDPVTGDFTLVSPQGTMVDKIEARTLINEICATKSGEWQVSSDAGILALSDVLYVTRTKVAGNRILLYPVPAGSYLYVNGLSGNETIEIYNLAGMKIMNIGKDEIKGKQIFTGLLPSGVYFLKVSSSQGVEVYRFVKE